MHLHRKTVAAAALVLALFGVSAGGSARAPGGQGHGPVVQLATLEQRVRPRRRIRGGKARAALWRTVRRVRHGAARSRAPGARLRLRLPLHDAWARGPP
jgi:hypothetical protein